MLNPPRRRSGEAVITTACPFSPPLFIEIVEGCPDTPLRPDPENVLERTGAFIHTDDELRNEWFKHADANAKRSTTCGASHKMLYNLRNTFKSHFKTKNMNIPALAEWVLM